jgi:hypothetical protein
VTDGDPRQLGFDFGNTRARPENIRWAGTPETKPSSDRIYADRRAYTDVFPVFDRSDTRPLPVAQLLSSKAPVLMYSYSAKTLSPLSTRYWRITGFTPGSWNSKLPKPL